MTMPKGNYEDGEILGLDGGYLVLWDAETQSAYNSGETISDYGRDNIRPHEMARLLANFDIVNDKEMRAFLSQSSSEG